MCASMTHLLLLFSSPIRGVCFPGKPPKIGGNRELNKYTGSLFCVPKTRPKTRSSDFRRRCDQYLATRPTETHATSPLPGHTPYAASHQLSLGISTHSPRRSQPCFCQSARCGHLSQIHERTPLGDLASGDSYRLETAQTHAPWYCKGSVKFLGRSACYNMLAEDRARSGQSSTSHTSPKLKIVRNRSIDTFQRRFFCRLSD